MSQQHTADRRTTDGTTLPARRLRASNGRGRPPESDDGLATIWTLGGILALLIAAAAVLFLTSVIAARHRAEAAADLAALGAGEQAATGEVIACAQARHLTGPLGATVTSCRIRGWDAYVEVSAALPAELRALGSAHARARAGPDPDPARGHLAITPDPGIGRDTVPG